MSLWGSQDQADESPIFTPAQVDLAPNTANRDALFNNTTPDAYTAGLTEGVFGVDATEQGVNDGGVVQVQIVNGGSGYDSTSNNFILVSGDGTGANVTFANDGGGVITSLTINAAGDGYTISPTLTVQVPGGGSGAELAAVVGGSQGVAHTGWQKRTVGSGNRAGRVFYETLVAGGITTDATDEPILPDS